MRTQAPGERSQHLAWVRDYYDALRPYSEEGGYVNFMSNDDQLKVRASYGGNFDRLGEVKKKYHPANLFRLNQNVAPGGG